MKNDYSLGVTILGAAGRQGRRRTDATLRAPGLHVEELVDTPCQNETLSVLANNCQCSHSTDWEVAVANPRTDVVVICTPNEHHAEMAIEALGRGKHVLLEKPLADNLEDGAKIAAEAANSGRLLKVGFNYRHRQPIAKAFAELRAGTIGTLTGIRAVIGHSQFLHAHGAKSWFMAGARGALHDLGIHMLDLALQAISIDGDEFELVTAQTTNRGLLMKDASIDEETSAIFKTRAGRQLNLQASWIESRKFLGARLELLGELGRIEADLTTRTTRVVRSFYGMHLDAVTSFEFMDPDPSWTAELIEFGTAIRQKKRVEVSAADAFQAELLVFAAYKSAESGGTPVAIAEFVATAGIKRNLSIRKPIRATSLKRK
jgi:predicted dehydrogenase